MSETPTPPSTAYDEYLTAGFLAGLLDACDICLNDDTKLVCVTPKKTTIFPALPVDLKTVMGGSIRQRGRSWHLRGEKLLNVLRHHVVPFRYRYVQPETETETETETQTDPTSFLTVDWAWGVLACGRKPGELLTLANSVIHRDGMDRPMSTAPMIVLLRSKNVHRAILPLQKHLIPPTQDPKKYLTVGFFAGLFDELGLPDLRTVQMICVTPRSTSPYPDLVQHLSDLLKGSRFHNDISWVCRSDKKIKMLDKYIHIHRAIFEKYRICYDWALGVIAAGPPSPGARAHSYYAHADEYLKTHGPETHGPETRTLHARTTIRYYMNVIKKGGTPLYLHNQLGIVLAQEILRHRSKYRRD